MQNKEFWLELAEGYDTISRETLEHKLFEDYGQLVHEKMREMDREKFLNLHLNPGMVQVVFVKDDVYRVV